MFVFPIHEDVNLVPAIGFEFHINETLLIYFECLVEAHTIENGSCASALLHITLLESELAFAFVLYLSVI